MLRLGLAKNLLFCGKLSATTGQRATYIRGIWPEPITQQTLNEFLRDISYFEDPKKFVNIGFIDQNQDNNLAAGSETQPEGVKKKATTSVTIPVDELFDLLGEEGTTPELDVADIRITGNQLSTQAFYQGIYRDLFSKYVPNRDFIKFTEQQAKNMDKLVPYYWITDQPFARVDRSVKEPDPVFHFDPIVQLCAKFIQNGDTAHKVYCGNIIEAHIALEKPAITLDGRSLKYPMNSSGRRIDNWSQGQVHMYNFPDTDQQFYTLALLNLDYLHENQSNLHWMITNMTNTKASETASYDEVCDYLPVHGIQGFGYSRYVFLLLQHNSRIDPLKLKVDGLSLEARKFDPSHFLAHHKDANMVPVGLSWFQTTWDESSNQVFHEFLNLKAPAYDHVQYNYARRPPKDYPGRIPFNVYLDHYRDKKEISKQVLLERLNEVDPFNYKDQYVPPKLPPTIHEQEEMPSWMKVVQFKKDNKLGYWRGLRPASAILPLNNNADLDHPIRPIASSKKAPPMHPNKYPGNPFKKATKNLPISKPANEHPQVFIQDDHENHLDKAKKIAGIK